MTTPLRDGGSTDTERSYVPFLVLGAIVVVAIAIALFASGGDDDGSETSTAATDSTDSSSGSTDGPGSTARHGAGDDPVVVLTGTDAAAPNYPPAAWLEREGWDGRLLLDDEGSPDGDAFGLEGLRELVGQAG